MATGELWAHATLRQDSAEASIGDLELWSEERPSPEIAVRGLHLKAVGAVGLRASVARQAPPTLAFRWSAVRAGQPAPGRGPWLVIGDQRGLAGALSAALNKRSESCVRFQRAERFERIEPGLYSFASTDRDSLDEALRAARTDGFPDPVEVVCIADEVTDFEALGESLPRNAVVALHTAQALLADSAHRPSPRMWLITAGAVTVGDEVSDAAGLEGAALWGLGRVLALEHRELRATLVDLPSRVSASVPGLLAALDSTGEEDQVAVRDGQLFARRVVHEPRNELAVVPASAFRLSGTSNTIAGLAYQAIERRAPAPDEIEIEVTSAALNFRDVLAVLGIVAGANGSLGAECAGVITRFGSAVQGFAVGDRVLSVFAEEGALASHTLAKASRVRRLPDGLNDEHAVSLPVAFLTALYGLRELGGLRAGQRVLVHSGAGGVGQAAIQVAKLMGLKVIATAGSVAKRQLLLRQGVEAVFDSRSTAFAQAIRDQAWTIDAVLGAVTGEIRDESLALLEANGCYLEMGKRELLSPESCAARYVPFDIIELGAAAPDRFRELLDEILAKVESGLLQPLRLCRFARTEVREAFAFFAHGKNVGKVVIAMTDEASAAARRMALGSYVVSGGLGELGLATVEWLVSRGARHLVLVSRTGPNEDASARLAALGKRGVQVVRLESDVADYAALSSLWASQSAALPPVRGIFHVAGVLRDTLLTNATVTDCEAMLRPKLFGARTLLRVFGKEPLDCFVLYSSAAAIFGSPGQTGYAMANSQLSRFAHVLRERGVPALAVDFGPWLGGTGMAGRTATLSAVRWQHFGLKALTPERALTALERALDADVTERIICDIDHAARANTALPPTLLRLFARPPQPATAHAAELSRVAAADRPAWVRLEVRRHVARAMGMSDESAIDDGVSLGDLGLDSLMSVELRNALTSSLGVHLPVSVLAERPSLARLSEVVLEQMQAGGVSSTPTATIKPSVATAIAPTSVETDSATPSSSLALLEKRMEPLRARLDLARAVGAYYFETPIAELDGPVVRSTAGESKLMFATYSYLGLLGHPRITAAAEAAVRRYGTGTHGVRLNGGTLDLHKRSEARIAGYLGREAAITFSSGYMTNLGVISTLVRPGDWVICDQWNHASIVDGCNASGGVLRVFPHADLAALERILQEAPPNAFKLVIADAVFSLDGDVLDLPEIVACCRHHGALLMVDEAHSIGILGPAGRGIEAHFNMPGVIDVCMGTLSKTIPAVGGFVAGSARLIEYLRFSARGYVFSAAMPPAVAAAALTAFDVLEEEGEQRQRALMQNVEFFLGGLRAAGFDTGLTTTAIIPVIVGTEERAIALTKHCHDHGVFAMPVLPPAVPAGTARLRLNVMASHSRADLERALAVIVEGGRTLPALSVGGLTRRVDG